MSVCTDWSIYMKTLTNEKALFPESSENRAGFAIRSTQHKATICELGFNASHLFGFEKSKQKVKKVC